MDSNSTTTRLTRRPTVEEWQRMSWRARQRYIKREQKQAELVINPMPVKPMPKIIQQAVSRCGNCGAWMIDKCGTGCHD